MKVLMLQVKKGPDITDVPHARALRLVEQGKAVPVREAANPVKKEKAAPAGERDDAQ